MNIVVLAGGLSTERDVSINSGKEIRNALIEKNHNVVLLDVFLGYEEKIDDIPSLFKNNVSLIKESKISDKFPTLDEIREMRKDKSDSIVGKNVLSLCKYADITFFGLHGGDGENGNLQALFDKENIKYTGTSSISARNAMDKDISKQIFLDNNVPTPLSLTLLSFDEKDKWDKFPCVVKPCNAGSSVGVHIVNDKDEYEESLKDAFKYDDKVLIEQYIKSREFSVGIIDNKALPVIEIVPKSGWFDYENKYQAGATDEICPAVIPDDIKDLMQKEAEHAFKSLDLLVYSRIDFLLDDNGDIFCLEANTLPGMTPASLLPKEAKATGMSYPDLCDLIVNLSLKKYN